MSAPCLFNGGHAGGGDAGGGTCLCCVGNCLSSTARYKPTLNGHQTFQAPALAENRQCRHLFSGQLQNVGACYHLVGWKAPGVPTAPSRPTLKPADLPDSSDLGGPKFRRSDTSRTKVGRKSQESELGPWVGPSSDSWRRRVEASGSLHMAPSRPTLKPADLPKGSDLGGPKFRRSDTSRTKVGRKSQESELGPSVGPSSDS